jgi:hypothetical protein
MERLKFTQRNEVIDILRASTMLLMIFVVVLLLQLGHNVKRKV